LGRLSRIHVDVDDDLKALVAGLICHTPRETDQGNLGTTCRILEIKRTAGPRDDKVTPTERRFQHLLAAEAGRELFGRVTRMVLMAKAQSVPVNYERLVVDLGYWNERTRREWASAFWIPMGRAQGDAVLSWLARIDLDRDRPRPSKSWIPTTGTNDFGIASQRTEQKRDFVTRIDLLEGAVRAWLLSEREPLRPNGVRRSICCEGNRAGIPLAQTLRLRPAGQPTKVVIQRARRLTNAQEQRQANRGKRVPLVSHEDLKSWIDRKAAEAASESRRRGLWKSAHGRAHFRAKETGATTAASSFAASSKSPTTVKFSEAYFKGIGTAKAFGFGLLLSHCPTLICSPTNQGTP